MRIIIREWLENSYPCWELIDEVPEPDVMTVIDKWKQEHPHALLLPTSSTFSILQRLDSGI